MDSAHNQETLIRQIRSIIPFRFLSLDRLKAFQETCTRLEYKDQETIISQGATDREVFLLIEGRVEVLDFSQGGLRHVSLIEPGHYFGEWEAIFDEPRAYSIRAAGTCTCLRFPEAVLLELLANETAFTQAMSGILREVQGIFKAFELFSAELARGVGYGHISIQKLLPLYQALKPALHARATDEDYLNAAALDYAVRRLPKNVTSTFAFLIRDELPAVYLKPEDFFAPVPTDARRRSIWEILPGKNMVLVRNGMSDICDLITCLCLYANEARKIRKMVYASKGVEVLWAYLCRQKELEPDLQVTEQAAALRDSGLPGAWVDGILRIWPRQGVRRVWEIVNHREMFTVDVRTQQKSYNLMDFAKWSTQIGAATQELFKCDPADLPADVEVHIVSSNTHSVANCLNPWYRRESGSILDWAQETAHPYLSETWPITHDLPYALVRDYFRAHPGAEQAMLDQERIFGILRLGATASTGIEVQLIDMGKVAGQDVDPLVHVPARGPRRLLVNIDYAFGEQAEHIIHQLILLFGRNMKSVNFLGKAGALQGERGDILMPTAFIEQARDVFMPVEWNIDQEIEALRSLVPGRQIHKGPMLTVLGTLMQNRQMLNFYRRLWKVTGLEMEGVFYHRQVQESLQTGLLDNSLKSRFLYYVSDLPLDTASNLAERLQASEGVPPLYAITRHVLRQILEG